MIYNLCNIIFLQIAALKFIGKSDNVEIHVDKVNKEIVLTGIIDNISSAMTAANKIIKTAQEQKQLNQKAKLVTDMVQWSFVEEQNGRKTFVEFPHDVNLLLEEAFKDDSTKVTFLASDGSKMVIDLTSYKMFPEDDPTDDNGVIRKTKLVSGKFKIRDFCEQTQNLLMQIQLENHLNITR